MRAGTSEDTSPTPPDASGMSEEIGGTHNPKELSLLGGFVFSVGGAALLGISAGSQRLLAFVALRDGLVTRNKAAGTLWAESTDEHAGASLRSAVSRLDGRARQALKVTALTWAWPTVWSSMSTTPRPWPTG